MGGVRAGAAVAAAVVVLVGVSGCVTAPGTGAGPDEGDPESASPSAAGPATGQAAVELRVNRSYTGDGPVPWWRIGYTVDARLDRPVPGTVEPCGVSPTAGGASLLTLTFTNTLDPAGVGEGETAAARPRMDVVPVGGAGPVTWVAADGFGCDEAVDWDGAFGSGWEYRDTVTVTGYLLDVPEDPAGAGVDLAFEHGALEYDQGEAVTVPLVLH